MDIVERLRDKKRYLNREAADKIEQLREALKDLLDATDQWVFHESYPLAVKKAKAALKESQ